MSLKEQYISDLPVADKINLGYELTKDDVLTEEGLLLVECLVRDGLTLGEVSKTLGINQKTFWNWRKENKTLDDACRRGKQLVDYKVESALLKTALGYKTKSVKTIIGPVDKEGNRKVSIEETVSETGPNVTACLAWLNNRKPEQWKRNKESVLEMEDSETGITINIVKGKKENE